MEYPYYRVKDFYSECDGAVRFSGQTDREIRSVIEGLFKRIDFSATVAMFRKKADLFAAGEFWGKLMRAACILYACTGDAGLKAVLQASMEDMLSVQGADGEISCTPREAQPNGTHGSDLWERKYVLLGMLAYYRVFRDERVLSAMCALADYTCAQVGSAPKTPITETGWAFCGIESSSILEPIVKLYGLTGREQYLTLARHIVEETGCCAREHMFYAIEAGKSPKDVGSVGDPKKSIAKAYEMMSCFEGLCEYYRATGERRWLAIAKIFFDKLLAEEITLLGSGGADGPYNLGPGTGEQWNGTRYEQTNPNIDLMMETCVTVTWMKLCLQMLRLTGDVRAADAVEVSYYNALSGALRPDGAFFDYFPRFSGKRGGRVNFTYTLGDFPLSCCTANGPAGYAMLTDAVFLKASDGYAVSLYLPGTYSTDGFCIRTEDGYPAAEAVTVSVCSAPDAPVSLSFRIPGWSEGFSVCVLSEGKTEYFTDCTCGYVRIRRLWRAGDKITLTFPRTLRCVPAPHGSNRLGDDFFALTCGPLVMARDKRFDPAFDRPLPLPENSCVPFTRIPNSDARLMLRAGTGSSVFTLIDYASAGKTWDEESLYRSWFPILKA